MSSYKKEKDVCRKYIHTNIVNIVSFINHFWQLVLVANASTPQSRSLFILSQNVIHARFLENASSFQLVQVDLKNQSFCSTSNWPEKLLQIVNVSNAIILCSSYGPFCLLPTVKIKNGLLVVEIYSRFYVKCIGT